MSDLKPCPFCGGAARAFHYNGTTQATCAKEHVECAGTDVCAPLDMWNTRTDIHKAEVQAARDQALEEAAQVAEAEGGIPDDSGSAPSDFAASGYNEACVDIASAIRALKGDR